MSSCIQIHKSPLLDTNYRQSAAQCPFRDATDIYLVNSGACPADETSHDLFAVEWPESPVGRIASTPCPCGNITQLLTARANRECLPGSTRAEWQSEDVSQCLALDFDLCTASQV